MFVGGDNQLDGRTKEFVFLLFSRIYISSLDGEQLCSGTHPFGLFAPPTLGRCHHLLGQYCVNRMSRCKSQEGKIEKKKLKSKAQNQASC